MKTGERIKLLREEAGLSQLDLSKLININNSVLSRIESGKRPVEDHELKTIADYFNVDADFLLGRKDIQRMNDEKKDYIDNTLGWTDEEKKIAEAVIQTLRQLKNPSGTEK